MISIDSNTNTRYNNSFSNGTINSTKMQIIIFIGILCSCLLLAYFHAASASGEKLAMLRSQREI